MTATIEQSAMMTMTRDKDGRRYEGGEKRPVVVSIKGVCFSSPLPDNAGQAETYNRIARAIVEALK